MVRFVEALPKTQTGKIQRFQLRSLSWSMFLLGALAVLHLLTWLRVKPALLA